MGVETAHRLPFVSALPEKAIAGEVLATPPGRLRCCGWVVHMDSNVTSAVALMNPEATMVHMVDANVEVPEYPGR